MNREQQGAPEPGLFNDIHREEGRVEGEFRDIKRTHEQREADKGGRSLRPQIGPPSKMGFWCS